MGNPHNFYQEWMKSRWFIIPKRFLKWSGIFSIGSVIAISIVGELKANLSVGESAQVLDGVGMLAAIPIMIFVISLFAICISWGFALIGPLFIGTGSSIVTEYRKIIGKDK